MDDFLLLIDGLMKIALVVGVMVLVATAPSGASAAAHGHGHEGALFAGMVGASAAHHDDRGSMRYAFEYDNNFAEHSALDQTNDLNAVAHQHEADHWRHDSDHESHRSSLIDADPIEHSFNIDGTPMFGGDFDIHGNTYGIIDWHGNDSWGGGTSSMFD